MVGNVPVQSVKKALDILDLLVEADLCDTDATLDALARRLGVPRNTAHNLLKTMVACGYVWRVGRGRYELGLKCRQLGLLNRLQAPAFQGAVREALSRLAEREGEACLLTVLVNGARVLVDRVDSTQSIQVSHATIEDMPFYSRATGRMLAAIASEEELAQIVARHGWPGESWDGIAGDEPLKQTLAELRRQGWSQTGSGDGLIGLACPVRDAAERAWGVLGLYAPAYRSPPDRCRQLLEAMRRCAAELKSALPGGIGCAQ